MNKSLLSLIVCLTSYLGFGQDSLSLLFIGDVMQHAEQIQSAYDAKTKTHDYVSCFKYIKHEMSDADITIANLEFTLGGKPYRGYPMFSAPDATVVALKDAGVDVLVTANNHTCDRRKKGVIRTLDVIDSLEFLHTGSFRNEAEKEILHPLLLEENGIRVALLNYTYGTNGMPIESPTVVNLINDEQIISDLEKAKKMMVDKIIVYMHWGSEYRTYPNDKQKRLAKLLFDNGADIVIGAHPHVLQPMENKKVDSSQQLIAYSLGNFVSYQRKHPKDGGAMFKLKLIKENGVVRIDDAGYLFTWVWVPWQGGKRRFYVMPASQYEDNPDGIMDDGSLKKMKYFLSQMRKLLNDKNIGVNEITYNKQSLNETPKN